VFSPMIILLADVFFTVVMFQSMYSRLWPCSILMCSA
jgi:hypothetical protein